jgi:hypothetical protein
MASRITELRKGLEESPTWGQFQYKYPNTANGIMSLFEDSERLAGKLLKIEEGVRAGRIQTNEFYAVEDMASVQELLVQCLSGEYSSIVVQPLAIVSLILFLTEPDQLRALLEQVEREG